MSEEMDLRETAELIELGASTPPSDARRVTGAVRRETRHGRGAGQVMEPLMDVIADAEREGDRHSVWQYLQATAPTARRIHAPRRQGRRHPWSHYLLARSAHPL